MIRSILAASILAAAVFGAAGAHAQDDHRTSVSTRGVDFSNPSDVKALYSRIRTAADVVCTTQGPRDMATVKYEKACVDDATREAVDNVNQPQLTEVAQGSGGGRGTELAVRQRRDDDSRSTR